MKTILKFTLLFTLVSALAAQQPKDPPQSQENKFREEAYKLSFVIYETEDGKKINQRDYIMVVTSNPSGVGNPHSGNLRIGTRVPITSEDKKLTYIEAGLDIRCVLRDTEGGKLQGQFDIELSGFVLPEQAANAGGSGNPVIRRTTSNSWTHITPGKSLMIASVDDLNSKKRTVIEVTATKLD